MELTLRHVKGFILFCFVLFCDECEIDIVYYVYDLIESLVLYAILLRSSYVSVGGVELCICLGGDFEVLRLE